MDGYWGIVGDGRRRRVAEMDDGIWDRFIAAGRSVFRCGAIDSRWKLILGILQGSCGCCDGRRGVSRGAPVVAEVVGAVAAEAVAVASTEVVVIAAAIVVAVTATVVVAVVVTPAIVVAGIVATRPL
jgi:hypothetical protein